MCAAGRGAGRGPASGLVGKTVSGQPSALLLREVPSETDNYLQHVYELQAF